MSCRPIYKRGRDNRGLRGKFLGYIVFFLLDALGLFDSIGAGESQGEEDVGRTAARDRLTASAQEVVGILNVQLVVIT